jgi:hypothetical protein
MSKQLAFTPFLIGVFGLGPVKLVQKFSITRPPKNMDTVRIGLIGGTSEQLASDTALLSFG